MKFASKRAAVGYAIDTIAKLSSLAIKMVILLLMLVITVTAPTFPWAGTGFWLFMLDVACDYALYGPVMLALLVAGIVSYELYDRRHNSAPGNLSL